MATEYHPITSEAEWLAMRKQDVTSTEVSALYGMSPYTTEFELWHQKNGTLESDFEDNDRIAAGRHLEPAIATLVAERHGVKVEPLKVYARDPEARMGSSFDYIITGHEHEAASELADHVARYGTGIMEIKNVDFLAHRDRWTKDECPDHIEVQLQQQLELTGYEWGAVVALVGGNRIWIYIRMRDKAVGKALRHAIAKFWSMTEAPPPVMPDDADAIIALHQFADPGTVLDARDDDYFASLAEDYDQLGSKIKALEDERKAVKANIIARAGIASKVLLANGTISCSQVADTPPTLITAEMVGTTYGGRSGYRNVRVTKPKAIKEKAA